MKVKIKKEGKVKEFKLISSWEDVTLEKWLKLIDFKEGTKTEEAEKTIALFSNIPRQLIKELALQDVAVIMSKMAELQEKQNSSLKKIIKIDDVEYGFHPELDSITLGEYADIEHYIKLGLENHLPEIMAVLYRPIKEKKNDIYIINAYDGNIQIRAEEMKKMSAEQVQSALVFFWHFGKELSKILPLYLMEKMKEMNKLLQQKVSQKNGHGSE
jgi:hypothetical protein|tara:strand:- start:10031 stop:10672 length:642 start_codon:yes stop_codon:yes gene_type:complete